MWISIAYIIIGLVGLVVAGDRFVAGASGLARNLGVTPLVIGLTIVAFGTSAPEIVVAIVAAIHGSSGLALGNALGSNITNIGLVLGVTALLKPIMVNSKILSREYLALFAIICGVAMLMYQGELTRFDGVMMLVAMIMLIVWIIWLGIKRRNNDPLIAEFQEEIPSRMSTRMAIFFVILGCLFLPLSSEVLVSGAVQIAKHLGVSDVMIGLTIVAIGTSLPEMAASIAGVIKQEPDIALGNVIGSNMFNLLAVLGFPAVIHPFAIEAIVLKRDYPVMVGFSVLLLLMSFSRRGQRCINRLEGVLLVILYLAYLLLLFLMSGA